jgi:hypothetical protein
MKNFAFLAFFLLLLIAACDTTGELPPNPFDPYKTDSIAGPDPVDVDPNSIVGLHYNIFVPTCANSGCHDGTFEPDFRSIESSYNTLVNHPIIKNDPQGTYKVRVMPGNVNQSVLWNRLTVDIDGQSGIMPLAIDPDSDWESNKEAYLQNVRNWIEGGAKDMFGNGPADGNIQPSMRGLIAYAGGNLLPREAGDGPIQVPAGAPEIEIWVALTDDQTAPEQLEHNKARFSTSLNDFANAPEQNMSIVSPRTEEGYFGEPVPYHHKVTLNLGPYAAGTRVFMRVYVKDPALSEPTEIPGSGSNNYIKEYFSFQIN